MEIRVKPSELYSWDFDPAKQQPELLSAWRDFIEHGEINPNTVRDCIADSWKRSRDYSVDPYRISPRGQLDPEAYRKRIAKSSLLIALASPIIEKRHILLKILNIININALRHDLCFFINLRDLQRN